jgi:hypothetical protein
MPFIGIMWEKIKPSFHYLLRSGKDLKKNSNQTNAISTPKIIKLVLALILSNIFFFMLFSADEAKTPEQSYQGVEIIIEGKLLTSFEKNKEVLLTHSNSGLKIKARLLSIQETQDHYLVLTQESDAIKILARPLHWNILPYLKNFTLSSPKQYVQEIDHEIHF